MKLQLIICSRGHGTPSSPIKYPGAAGQRGGGREGKYDKTAIAQLVLPALGTLYFAPAQIWGFPYAEAIVGTISSLDAFLGTVLKLSSDAYYKSIE